MPQTCCKFSILLVCCNLSTDATNLSISSSRNKSVKIRLVAICHLQTCYNLLKQLAASLWITSFDNQLATSLLTRKLWKDMRTHPDIGLLIKISTDLLQFVAKSFQLVTSRLRTAKHVWII